MSKKNLVAALYSQANLSKDSRPKSSLKRNPLDKRSVDTSAVELRKAINSGSFEEMIALADSVFSGKGVEKYPDEGFTLIVDASNKDHILSMVALGMTLLEDKLNVANLDAGVSLLTMASDLGSPDAKFYLGKALMQGDGVEKNPQEAVRLFKEGADLGDIQSMASLGAAYLFGTGVQNNDQEAKRWFIKANGGGARPAGGAKDTGTGKPNVFTIVAMGTAETPNLILNPL